MNGNEIRNLLFGREASGIIPSGSDFGRHWWDNITKDGKLTRQYGVSPYDEMNKDEVSRKEVKMTFTGKAWIDGDMFFKQYKSYRIGRKMHATIFRNPEGTLENKDEYLMVWDKTTFPFSVVD